MQLIIRKFFLILSITFLHSNAYAFPSEIGNAIIMDDALDGKISACDLKYDKSKYFAAHKTLPCGTKVRVTVLETNKSVELIIVDRGPYVQGQIIAISSKAANTLGIVTQKRVKVELVDEKKNVEKPLKKSSKSNPKKESGLNIIQEASTIEKGGLYKMQVLKLEPKGWGVQVAVYSSYESVIQQLAALQNNWFKGGLVYAEEIQGKLSYKVIMGPFFTKEEADSYCNSVKQKYKVKDAFVVDLNLLKDNAK